MFLHETIQPSTNDIDCLTESNAQRLTMLHSEKLGTCQRRVITKWPGLMKCLMLESGEDITQDAMMKAVEHVRIGIPLEGGRQGARNGEWCHGPKQAAHSFILADGQQQIEISKIKFLNTHIQPQGPQCSKRADGRMKGQTDGEDEVFQPIESSICVAQL